VVGDVVGGFIIKEALGSGRSGLLYLAVSASGHRAVVRRRLGDDELEEFARETAQVLALGSRPVVERRKTHAGVAVLFALVDGGAPGSGFTEHTNTDRLPTIPRRRSAGKWRVLLLLSCCVVTGAVLSAGLLRSSQTHVASSLTSTARPVVVVSSNSEPIAAPVPEPAPNANVARDAGINHVQGCKPDPAWKRARLADVDELLDLGSASEALYVSVETPLRAASRSIRGASTEADCSRLGARLTKLYEQLTEATPCTFDDGFRQWAWRSRDELRGAADRDDTVFAGIQNELNLALRQQDCRRARVILFHLRMLTR
jgi:hypothetical protein